MLSRTLQLDYRTKCLNLREDLERANSEVFLKEHVRFRELGFCVFEQGHRKDMELLKRECEQKIACLEAQVKESLHEKATYEATISQLHGDLAAHKSHMQVLAMRLDQIHVEVESKYNSEVQDLRECLAVEQEEKNELNRKIQNLEKELLICKAKLVDQQQEMTANWHVETLKQKIMKLRRENEVLKRKFSHSEEKK
uniref:Protein At-4/1 n=1 Tax=Cajanus cajan TaxID=3821 RepID=A0A151RW07_CAJCA|nr:hypothetical protein KK1_031637 [Cajanus cajan]